MKDKKILMEIWKVWNYCSLILLFILIPSLIALWKFNYKIGFWILLIFGIITQIGTGIRISKLEKNLI